MEITSNGSVATTVVAPRAECANGPFAWATGSSTRRVLTRAVAMGLDRPQRKTHVPVQGCGCESVLLRDQDAPISTPIHRDGSGRCLRQPFFVVPWSGGYRQRTPSGIQRSRRSLVARDLALRCRRGLPRVDISGDRARIAIRMARHSVSYRRRARPRRRCVAVRPLLEPCSSDDSRRYRSGTGPAASREIGTRMPGREFAERATHVVGRVPNARVTCGTDVVY